MRNLHLENTAPLEFSENTWIDQSKDVYRHLGTRKESLFIIILVFLTKDFIGELILTLLKWDKLVTVTYFSYNDETFVKDFMITSLSGPQSSKTVNDIVTDNVGVCNSRTDILPTQYSSKSILQLNEPNFKEITTSTQIEGNQNQKNRKSKGDNDKPDVEENVTNDNKIDISVIFSNLNMIGSPSNKKSISQPSPDT